MVHAVLDAAAPGVTIIDLTHQIPAFDVRAGRTRLVRVMPHLGPGVVLAVVDPGVGSARRGLCIEVTLPGGDPRFFVGPDNGLLIVAAESAGEAPISRAFGLRRDRDRRAGTFDGRDLFAPVAAALCRGVRPEDLGDPVDPESLCGSPVAWWRRVGSGTGGAACGPRSCGWTTSATCSWRPRSPMPRPPACHPPARWTSPSSDVAIPLRRVGTFADLAQGELGLLIDPTDTGRCRR